MVWKALAKPCGSCNQSSTYIIAGRLILKGRRAAVQFGEEMGEQGSNKPKRPVQIA